jgi:DNA mismatch repair protein MutS
MDGGRATPETARANATPMMTQYLAIRDAHPGYLLFYRMGDFYEVFFEDAVKAAETLDITLTQRGQHGDDPIPMAGVPVKSHEVYLERLIRAGHKVAICEQTESLAEAKKRSGKTLLARDVVRMVTPGTLTEDTLLDARRHNFLAAMAESGGKLGLAWLDLSTGRFETESLRIADLAEALARIEPKELIVPDRLLERAAVQEGLAETTATLTDLPAARFDSGNAERRLKQTFGVDSLDGFGAFDRAEIAAAGVLVDYVDATQKGQAPRLDPPERFQPGRVMLIDPATRRSLELFRTQAGERKGSLLSAIDRTVSSAGARLLAGWLAAPSTDPAVIEARQNAVALFHDHGGLAQDMAAALSAAPDLARALSRLALGRGGPRDLAAVGKGLEAAATVSGALASSGGDLSAPGPPALLADASTKLIGHDVLAALLNNALSPDLPLLARDGGFVAPGYDPELDELRGLREDSRKLIAALQARYAEETGIANLKLKHNAVLGYFIETSPANEDKLVSEERFIRRQTMANAVRFSTVELSDLEAKIASAADRTLARELETFDRLRDQVLAASEALARVADALALVDVTASLGRLAVEQRHVRPKVDGGLAFDVRQGRHPVVEPALLAGAFVPNDCDLSVDAKRLWLITGPNMAGKSTYLRQNALIAIMAQVGAFVPAASAHIGIVDRLFSRVGASDDLARGRSTFMVEMVETAAILNQAGERALVILDEIGRGTATYDGLSIAWAAVERLHDKNRCRGLFATHYHELTQLAEKLDGLALASMRVKEWRGDIAFLHEVAPGAADRSYGVHVARLAGLPKDVVRRAANVLAHLEAGEGPDGTKLQAEMPLFAHATPVMAEPEPAALPPGQEEALSRLAALDPDQLTPRQALELAYTLADLVKGEA